MKKKNLKIIFAVFAAAASTLTFAFAAACGDSADISPSDDSGIVDQLPQGGDETPSQGGDETPSQGAETPSGAEAIYWNKVASFATGFSDADGGVAEIVQYNEDNGKLYLVNGKTQTIDIVTLAGYGSDGELQTKFTEDTDRISFDTIVEENPSSFEEGFEVGDITSVAVNTGLDMIAVAVQHSDYSAGGAVVLLDYDGKFKAAYSAGVQPDMVTFAGNMVLTANEGEPREGYGNNAVDPMGSVTVIDLDDSSPEAKTVTFENFDSKRDELVEGGVLLKKNTAPSVDLEPEYIAAYGNYAYVSLQEANAIAVLNLETLQFENVYGLGFKDHSRDVNGLDLLEDGVANIQTQDVYGVYMPDGLDIYQAEDGKIYLVTANEGDAREWGDYSDVEKVKIDGFKVEVLVNSEFDGLEEDKNYVLGGRSFSVWDVTDMSLVFDSGDMIESYIAASEEYSPYFNCNNDDVELDSRSKKKGPEPEAVHVEVIDGKTYVFVALERQGGAMMFDITDFADVSAVSYANSRDYTRDMAGDVAPESIDFIPAAMSPNGKNLLILANENSGTVAVYAMESEQKSYEMHAEFIPAEEEEGEQEQPAEEEVAADHLLIWSVFGNGGKDDGQTSNDFIAIYNPTDSAVDLAGWKVRYSTLRDGGEREWQDITLSGTLAPHDYFIIIGEDTGNESPLISFAEGEYDIKVEDFEIDNKQYSVQLTDADGKVVDSLGVDEETTDAKPEISEGEPVVDINKHSIVTRTSDVDTDDNATDFSIVDLRKADNASDYKPVKNS